MNATIKNVAVLLFVAFAGFAANHYYHYYNSEYVSKFFQAQGCQSIIEQMELKDELAGKVRDVLLCPSGSTVGITR